MQDKIFWALDNALMVEVASRNYEFNMAFKHFHNEYEIYYLLAGERYYFISDQIYPIKKGTIVFIDSNQIHKTSTANQTPHARLLIHIRGSLFEKYAHVFGGLDILKIFKMSLGVIHLNEEEQAYIEAVLFFIAQEAKVKAPQHESLLLAKLIELFVFFLRKQTECEDDQKPLEVLSAKHKKIHEVANYITHHFAEPISLEELAQKFFVSKYYLCRVFKEVTGFTVNEYINITKIKQAQTLLEQSDLNITQIAEAVGYSNLTHFEKVFKTYLNITPLKYRKSLKLEKMKS